MKRYLPMVFCASVLFGEAAEADRLFQDLEIARKVDREICDALPVLRNYQGLGGYFAMPSARMDRSGMIGAGYAWVHPYHVWNLSFQFFDHVEASGTYWVYRGVADGNLSQFGFGDYAERSANVKFSLHRPEDGYPWLPDFAIGWDDFFGSCLFTSFYAVATEELLSYNLEATVGWGSGRIKGWFGGLAWTPWRRSETILNGLTLAAEYDANNYKHHACEHPDGRKVKSRLNLGAHLRLGKYLELTASSIRGVEWGASLAAKYNLGESTGLFPKVFDPPCYTAPIDTEPVGRLRSGEEMARDLAFAFREQGFELYQASLVPCPGGEDRLWCKVANLRYREEECVRGRMERVLGSLAPSNVFHVAVVVEADGVPVHQYRFRLCDLFSYREGCLGEEEFRVIAPIREAGEIPCKYTSALLYQRLKPAWVLTFKPYALSFFGSSKGKFKGQAGFTLGIEGYLFGDLFYSAQGSLTLLSQLQGLGSWDTVNPSKIINVRTDAMLYHQAHSFHVDTAYLQRSFNLGKGWFTRFAGGYFETAYGGAAWEAIYYPVQCNWAVGAEAALVWKRNYYGLNFSRKIRKLTPEGPIHVPYTGLQYFLDFYYDYRPLNLDFKASIGQFLARDKGIRLDAGRTFSSGLRVGLWYTFTNANDVVNGKRYYDKGVSVTMPLDLFLTQSSRTRIGYGMSAWLRDCGAKAFTGKELHHTIYYERYNPHEVFY